MATRPLFVVLAALWLPAPVHAERVDAKVAFHDELVVLSLDARVNASVDAVITLLNDYEHLEDVFPLVRSAERLGSPRPRVERVETQMRGCILFVCRNLRHTLDVEHEGSGRFRGITVPEHSEVLFGHFLWRIDEVTPEPPRTRIRLNGRFQPELRIPPLLGRPLVRHMLEHELQDSIRRIEDHLGATP
ncbi:MAG: SRPBCC family protein [Pseudomonadota bacterium]